MARERETNHSPCVNLLSVFLPNKPTERGIEKEGAGNCDGRIPFLLVSSS